MSNPAQLSLRDKLEKVPVYIIDSGPRYACLGDNTINELLALFEATCKEVISIRDEHGFENTYQEFRAKQLNRLAELIKGEERG